VTVARTFRLLFSLVVCASVGWSAQPTVAHIGNVATVMIEAGMEWGQDPQPMPDFSVYYLRQGQRILLGVYVGNAPGVELAELKSKLPVGTCAAVSNISQAGASNDFDAVLSLEGADFPRYLHFFSRRLSKPEFDAIQNILKTLQVLPPYQC
jgi:hypothetical protein